MLVLLPRVTDDMNMFVAACAYSVLSLLTPKDTDRKGLKLWRHTVFEAIAQCRIHTISHFAVAWSNLRTEGRSEWMREGDITFEDSVFGKNEWVERV